MASARGHIVGGDLEPRSRDASTGSPSPLALLGLPGLQGWKAEPVAMTAGSWAQGCQLNLREGLEGFFL